MKNFLYRNRGVVLAMFLFVASCVVIGATPGAAFAQSNTGVLPACSATAGGCGACDLLALFGNIAMLILNSISVIVVLSLIIGGLYWILSFGNPERVDRGKQIIIGAFIGLGFVMGGFLLVNVTLVTLTGQTDNGIAMPFGTVKWDQICKDQTLSKDSAKQNVPGVSSASVKTACNPNGGNGDDRSACVADGCTNESACQCYGAKCVPTCAVAALGEYGSTGHGICVANSAVCASNSGPRGATQGEVKTGVSYACPSSSASTCCVVSGDGRRSDNGKTWLIWDR